MMHPYGGMHQMGGMLGALRPVASIAALAGTIYLTPILFSYVEADIWNWINTHYSPGTSRWLFWAVEYALSYLSVFIAIKAILLGCMSAAVLLLARWLI